MSKDINDHSIFGEYKQEENKITAALLQILHRGGKDLINEILFIRDKALPSDEISVVSQEKEEKSIPDGTLSCNFSFELFIESKIKPNSIKKEQLNNHKKLLTNKTVILIYITPDSECPNELKENNSNLIWYSWSNIVDTLQSYIIDKNDDEILAYLIEQFDLLIENSDLKLYDYKEKRVIIVGGSFADQIAKEHGFYACQKNRSFKTSKYIAFAYNNRISNVYEIEGESKSDYNLEKEGERAKAYIDKYGEKIITYFKLKHIKDVNIENDAVSKNGKRCAFVQNQRYTTIDKILAAKKTSDLL